MRTTTSLFAAVILAAAAASSIFAQASAGFIVGRSAEKRFGFKRWSVAPYIDIFNITNHDSVVQPNYEFYSPTTQFLSENRRLPIFGFRLEF